jgi:hypothetical protein
VSATSPDRGGLRFRHTRIALGVLAAVAALVGLLAWLDHARAEQEIARWRGALCGELPRELTEGLAELTAESTRAPLPARQALAVLEGLFRTQDDRYVQARILFESKHGWRELRPWSEELGLSHDPDLLEAARTRQCLVTLEHSRLRAVRPLRLASGLQVLLAAERTRR